ncbi:siderophore-interacting protein [Ottowia thiooxydans]|uniref:siderophore-interacting protein n=1 Tax=Ottowia thiooxydans TaxID=219182 RepID=UPI00040C9EA2|nr:siderophore-interacting protein [Ottowia thiooxydans]
MTTSNTLDSNTTTDPRASQRIRHELRLRQPSVQSVERLSPNMIRIVLQGEDLKGFTSLGFDDHVKLMLPDPATGVLSVPSVGPDGIRHADGAPRPAMRDYTPRSFDAQAGLLTLDFAVHDAGPATQWAEQAKPGQKVGIGGPRGSMIIPMAFDGYLLVGDDTALPAIARRLAELPSGAPVLVIAEVDSPADELRFETTADLRLIWVHRQGAAPGTTTLLLDALRKADLPAGDFHAWVACETSAAKAMRAHLVGERGARPAWTKAAGYWRVGAADSHETHND